MNLTIINNSKVATLKGIANFEKRNKIIIPQELKYFLTNYNVINSKESLFKLEGKEFWVSSFYPFDENYELSLQTSFNNLNDFFENKYLANGDKGGGITEEISDILYQTDGFVKKEVKLGSNQGIDGLYVKGSIENPTAIHIDEAKYSKNFDKKGIQLNKAKESTELPPQMSDDWIENVAERMIRSGDKEVERLGIMLQQNMDKIKKSVTTVNPKTGEINILKLDSYTWEH